MGGPACPPRPRSCFSLRLVPQTERDVSVRQRAVDLLYAMCDRSNAQQIVAEMLSYLETADYAIREEIVSAVGLSGHRGPRPEGLLWFLMLSHRRHCEPAGCWVEASFALVFKQRFGRGLCLL